MKKLFQLLIIICCASQVGAQKFGGFGLVSFGGSSFNNSSIQNRLQEAAVLGKNFSFNATGSHVGLRVLGVYNKVLIGGAGYTNSFSGDGGIGSASFKVNGRFLNLGYIFLNKSQNQIYAFAGFGGRGGNLTVTKTDEVNPRTISFGPNQDVIISEDITQRSMGYEFGVGFNKLILSKNNNYGTAKSGLILGIVGGVNFFPTNEWEFKANGSKVEGMGSINNVYFGITLGGGGFSQ